MRKVILAMLLAIVNNSAMAEWEAFGVSNKYTVYINSNLLSEDGKTTRMWHLFDYKTAESTNCNVDYISTTMQYEYDCKAMRFRGISHSAHSEHMGEGNEILSNIHPSEWESVVPHSFGEKLFNKACGAERDIHI